MDPLSPQQGTGSTERIAFITGTLAEPALRKTLAHLGPAAGFVFEVVALNIQVAALMTAPWAARRLPRLSATVDRAIVPGHLSGSLTELEAAAGVPCERGPKDLRELPRFFGREVSRDDDYGGFDIEILAEINHVPQLSMEEIVHTARRYAASGADVVDLGCDPGGPFAGIARVVRELKQEGLRVSVDSLDPREIVPAVEAGAELVLSVNSRNVGAVGDLDCEFVAIPDEAKGLAGLERTLEKLEIQGARYRVDPILEPIGFGFADSLGRYLEVRRRYPECEILMGVGNLTELTGTDSAAINVLLLGFCAEVGIRSVLTTEVAPWARTCVRELDVARRLVHHAIAHGRVPKHLEPDLHVLRDEEVLSHGAETLRNLAAGIKDKNIRLFAEDGLLHAIQAAGHVQGQDPFELFSELGVTDAEHAFYLGYELAKAVTALTLGKNYVQDQALRWGFLTVEEPSFLEGKPPQHRARRRP